VRDTEPDTQGNFGRGIAIQAASGTGDPGRLTVHSSLVVRNHDVGLFVRGSEATIEATVVRDTLSSDPAEGGRAIGVQYDPPTGAPASTTVRSSLLERGSGGGMLVAGSDATLESTVVRNTLPAAHGMFGRGLAVQFGLDTLEPANVTLHGSLVENNQDLGVLVGGSHLTLVATVVRDTSPDEQGRFGRGIHVQDGPSTMGPPTVTVRSSQVDRSCESGIFVTNAVAAIEATVLQGTAPSPAVGFGDGFVAVSERPQPGSIQLRGCRLQANIRAGAASFGTAVALAQTLFDCNTIHLNGEQDYELSGFPISLPFSFDDEGGNVCGCGEEATECVVLSAGLAPPPPVEDSTSP
jgi:hypothetical protein